jgi:type II secretory pathway pseudopilin PulG
MRKPGSFVRIRARLHDDERGFSLVETVIAITIIFGSLITLAMSASTGFRYVGVGREEQAANQIANQLMEQVRGLAFTKIAQGLQTSGLSSDPYLVTSCAGDVAGTYRFGSCSGAKVVSTNFNCPTRASDCSTPIVPNNGTIGASDDYPVDYHWRTYVTNDCQTATATGCTTIDPYRVTVIVEWAGAGTAANGIQRVTTQSLFHSPTGCVSSQTHPFAAPCQPFFYGQAIAPVGQISATGTVSNLDFSSGVITTTGADSTLQIEQVSSGQGGWTQTGTQLTTSAGTSLGGATTDRSTAADSDPSGTTPSYSATTAGALGTGSNQFAGTVASGTTLMQVQNAANDTGQAISAMSAGGSNACPPVPPLSALETDLLPCGGAYAKQAGTSRIVGHFHGFATDLGDATIVSIANPSAAMTTFANRIAVTGTNGNVQDTASRAYGTIKIGGLPENVSAPTGWAGYLVQLASYQDTVVSTAGTSAAAPSATINGGTLSYWNGTGYTSVALATTPAYALSNLVVDRSTTVSGHTVEVKVATDSLSMEQVPTTSTTPTGSGSITRTETNASIGSPILGTFTYEVWVDGGQVVDLEIDVSLGTLSSKSIYQPAPSAGS